MPSDPPAHPPEASETTAASPAPAARPTREFGKVLWKQMRNELARAIIRGVFRPGAKVPSVQDLRDEYTCGAVTAQRALAALHSAGFLAPPNQGAQNRVATEPPTKLPADWVD